MNWSEEDDLNIAEIALRHLRENGTTIAAFDEISRKISIEADLCESRWEDIVKYKYESARQIARAQFEKRKSTKPSKKTMKDWEYWKKRYMEEVIRDAEDRISVADMHESPIEKIAGLYLFKLYENFPIGIIKTHPQVIIGKYTVDFMVTYELNNGKEIGIVIECDGHDFHEKTKEQVKRDKERDRFMTKEGYMILRYSGSEIVDDPLRIVIDVQQIIYKVLG